MNRPKGLVVDANILIRAVFGERVRQILGTYEDAVAFYAPDVCFLDAARYIPDVAQRRNFSAEFANSVLLASAESCNRWIEAFMKSTSRQPESGSRNGMLMTGLW
jgi:hypothetical protein